MEFLISILIIMILIAILEYQLVMKKSKMATELKYIIKRNKLKLNKKNIKRNHIIIALTNGLIIGITSTIIFYINLPLVFCLPLALVLMVFMINIFYNYIIIKLLK